MLTTTKTISLNGTSAIEVDGTKKTIAYFNAQIQTDGKFNINESVQDEELYDANEETVDADMAEFKSVVKSCRG